MSGKRIKVSKLRNILVGLIVICMVVTLIPVNAFASEASGIENGVSEQIIETTDDVQLKEDKTIEQTGLSEEEIRAKLQSIVDEVNSMLPPFKRVLKLVVRTEDFKKTGALKIDRNQN